MLKYALIPVLFCSPLFATFEADVIEYNLELLESKIAAIRASNDPYECIDVCQDMIHIIHYTQVLYDTPSE